MRALILEDQTCYRDLLDQTFTKQGFFNDISESIADAQQSLSAHNYDVICINQRLKDGSVEKFIESCHRDEQLKDVPILFVINDEEAVSDALKVQVNQLIYDFDQKLIEDQIVRFLELQLDPIVCEGRILYADSDSEVSKKICALLEQAGYRVSHFDSNQDAWEEFDQVKVYGTHLDAYDLAITEVDSVENDTEQPLVDKIRTFEDGRGFIPIIAISHDNDPQRRISFYQRGVNDFLPKPILNEELLVRVKNLITNKRLLDRVHDIRRDLFAIATTDELTGCHNRHSLMGFSEKFISQAKRHKYPVSMLVIDLDHFKSVNDNHGHAIGDTVLRQTGALLNRSFRNEDLVARYGGEEFVVLMSHCDSENAVAKAEKIRQAIEDLKPNGLTITTSIGATALEIDNNAEKDFETMFHAGDEAVYKAKDKGRNQVVYIALD